VGACEADRGDTLGAELARVHGSLTGTRLDTPRKVAETSQRKRPLWPREHGAYAQLLAPLATALVLVRPTLASGLLASAACAGFLANEPLLVVLGHRGKRLREQQGRDAARRLAVLATVAGAVGAAGLVLAPNALPVAALVAIPALLTIVLAWRRLERTLAGELGAAVALSGASALVLVASGATQGAALAIWGAWAIGFACTVVAVHRVIARNRAAATWRDTLAIVGLLAVTSASAALLIRGSLLGAATPLALASMILVIRPPRATYLRTIGVALVVASVATGALAFASL